MKESMYYAVCGELQSRQVTRILGGPLPELAAQEVADGWLSGNWFRDNVDSWLVPAEQQQYIDGILIGANR